MRRNGTMSAVAGLATFLAVPAQGLAQVSRFEADAAEGVRAMLGVLAVVLVAALVGTWRAVGPRDPSGRRFALGVALATAVGGALRWLLSPHAFLHEYYHHVQFIHAQFEGRGFQTIYGETAPALYRIAASLVGPDEAVVFGVNALLSTATIAATAWAALALTRHRGAALLAAWFLALLPAHLRHAAAEDPVVPAACLAMLSLAFVLHALDTRRTWDLIGAAAALVLAAHARPETLAWIAAMPVLVVLARGRPGLEALANPRILAAAVAAGLLIAPRIAVLAAGWDDVLPMTRGRAPIPGEVPMWWRALTRADVHLALRPEATPVFVPLFALAGAAWMAVTRPGVLVALALPAVGLVAIAPHGHDNPQALARSQVMIQPVWAIVAGAALPALVAAANRVWRELVSRIRPNAAPGAARGFAVVLGLLLAAAAPVGLVHRAASVAAVPESHQEWRFLRDAIPTLPPGARVIAPASPTPRDLASFPAWLLRRLGRDDVSVVDLRRALDAAERGGRGLPPAAPDLLFFQGMYCHFAFENEPAPEPMHARCRAVRERYRLAPMIEADLTGPPSSLLRYAGGPDGPWRVGFYRVTGERDGPEGGSGTDEP